MDTFCRGGSCEAPSYSRLLRIPDSRYSGRAFATCFGHDLTECLILDP
jgi:hypothetical protein